jgi:hypothetical protein
MHESLEHELTGVEIGYDFVFREPAEVPAARIALAPFLESKRLRDDLFCQPHIAVVAAHKQAMCVPDTRVRHMALREKGVPDKAGCGIEPAFQIAKAAVV